MCSTVIGGNIQGEKTFITIMVVIAGNVVIEVGAHAGIIKDAAVNRPFFGVRPVRYGVAVGGISQITCGNNKQRIYGVAGLGHRPGEIVRVLTAAGADVGIGYNHKPEKPVATMMVVGLASRSSR